MCPRYVEFLMGSTMTSGFLTRRFRLPVVSYTISHWHFPSRLNVYNIENKNKQKKKKSLKFTRNFHVSGCRCCWQRYLMAHPVRRKHIGIRLRSRTRRVCTPFMPAVRIYDRRFAASAQNTMRP